MTESDPGTTDIDDCIDTCLACHQLCLETLTHSLREGGELALPEHIRVLADCAQLCQTNADFMIRGSDLHGYTCGACAVVCDACAESCGGFPGDSQLDECAALCRRCAQACRAMEGYRPEA